MMMQKLTSFAATLAFLTARAEARVIIDPGTNIYNCPQTRGTYCPGASLNSNIIVRCKGYIGNPENCGYQLFNITPLGIKHSALCYQVDPAVGNASCSLDGIVYPENGEQFPIQDRSTPATLLATSKFGLNVLTVTSPEPADKSHTLKSNHQVMPAHNEYLRRDISAPTATTGTGRPFRQLLAEEITKHLPLQATSEFEVSVDINGPSQALRACNDSDILPEFALEGICNVPTSSETSIPQAAFEAEVSPDINGPSQALRDCGDGDLLPEFAFEGICKPSKAPVSQAVSEAEASPDINGPSQALRECGDGDILPEFALEGICNFPGATNGISKPSSVKRELETNDASNSSSTRPEVTVNRTSNLEPAAPTVAPYTGSANIYGVGVCAVGAEVLVLTLFLLAN